MRDDEQRTPSRGEPGAGHAPMAEDSLSELAAAVGRALEERGWTLALAESCTGGWVGKAITDIPGSSSYFQGGVVAYANAAKHSMLGVPTAVLQGSGAVSEAVAREMAVGARRVLAADVAVSVTGVAGPGGGSPARPVGTTWFAVATAERVTAERIRFPGDREEVRLRAVAHALRMLIGASADGRSGKGGPANPDDGDGYLSD